MSDRLFTAIMKSWVGFFTVAAFLLSVGVFFYAPETSQIPTRWFLVALLIWLAAFTIVFRAFYDSVAEGQRSPKVIAALPSARYFNGSKTTLLVESAWFLAVDSMVSVYQLSGDVEHEIAFGVVVNIQNDRRVQIALLSNEHNGSSIERIATNSQFELAKIIVKPTVSRRAFGEDI